MMKLPFKSYKMCLSSLKKAFLKIVKMITKFALFVKVFI